MKDIRSFFKKDKCKICVPLMGKTYEEIINNLNNIISYPFDVLEWRADFYEDLFNKEKVKILIDDILKKINGKPLLFTIRTSQEGGNIEINVSDYKEIILDVIKNTDVDIIDVEYMRGEDISRQLVCEAHSHNKYIIGSYHDFDKTPGKEEIYDRLLAMKKLDMDVSKIALMPQNKKDVLALFEVTEKINEDYKDILTITMSMGQLGAISRIALGKFGSVMTFGAVGQVSAPGQYNVEELSDILNKIYWFFERTFYYD